MLHQRVVVVVLGEELAAPPVESEPVVPEGELVLPLELELEEPLPLVPGPPIELVLASVLGDELLLVDVSLLLLVLGLVLAVLGLVGEVELDELVEPVVPGPLAPVVASRFWQAPSERAATTAKVAAAH